MNTNAHKIQDMIAKKYLYEIFKHYHISKSAVFTNMSTIANVILILYKRSIDIISKH